MDELHRHQQRTAQNQPFGRRTRPATAADSDAEVLLTSFGITARFCKKAVDLLREEGIAAGLFRPITLWPFPGKELFKVGKNVRKIVCVEMNAGQMVEDVKLSVGEPEKVSFLGRTGGGVPSVSEIVEFVK